MAAPDAPAVPTTPTNQQAVQFQSDEILWYRNGIWGECGYAIPNSGGKNWTYNGDIFGLMQMIGRNVFEFAHRESVKFYTAPHKQFWYDVHQMLTVGIKRCADLAIRPNSDHVAEPTHATPTPQVFLVYPIPYFKARVRQLDIARILQKMLMLQTEIMQHTDNERGNYFTAEFAGMVTQYLQECLAWIATKYFGYSRDESYAPGFKIADERFSNYNPDLVLTSAERTEERQPPLWWPTENDLSRIRGIPINEAILLAERWPREDWLAVADANVLVTTDSIEPAGAGDEAQTQAVAVPNRAP
ncbi:MAG: hypothetical protein K2Y37_14750 [Pirellulales bacterium]|nr:hypothetical protein [Pirellulales bacterium]